MDLKLLLLQAERKKMNDKSERDATRYVQPTGQLPAWGGVLPPGASTASTGMHRLLMTAQISEGFRSRTFI